MLFALSKVHGGKSFKGVHPLVSEARASRAAQVSMDNFILQAEQGRKDNPLASLPGARRYVPGVTKPPEG